MSDLESEADDPLELALMECCEFEPTNSLQLATIKLEGPVKQEDTDEEMVEDTKPSEQEQGLFPADESSDDHCLEEACGGLLEEASHEASSGLDDAAPLEDARSGPDPPAWNGDGCPLATIITSMLLLLSAVYAMKIKQQIQNIDMFLEDNCVTHFAVTTACSGSDLIVPSLLFFFEIAAKVLSTSVVLISHLWSCENTEFKAKWIKNVMGTSVVFRDIGELASGDASVWWDSAKQLVQCGLLYACGFSCKSISALNNNAAAFAACIASRKGTTGQTWWATYLYVKKFWCLWCWFENVARLSGANLDAVVALLRALGYIVIVLLLTLAEHGPRCRRQRRWIICKLEPQATVAEQQFL